MQMKKDQLEGYVKSIADNQKVCAENTKSIVEVLEMLLRALVDGSRTR